MGREVRRVPLSFDQPLGENWAGFINPFYAASKTCADCEGKGLAPEARVFHDEWWGYRRFDPVAYGSTPLTIDHPYVTEFAVRQIDADESGFYRSRVLGCPELGRVGCAQAIENEKQRIFGIWSTHWMHQLSQADVDAIAAADRLPLELVSRWDQVANDGTGGSRVKIEPPPVITPAILNDYSLRTHYSSNFMGVLIKARCERAGVAYECATCKGEGTMWPSEAAKWLAEEGWQEVDPPKGDAYQLWQTVSEGAPISPPFATPEELAAWLTTPGNGWWNNDKDITYEQWVAFISGPGWAFSAASSPEHGVESGVVAAVREASEAGESESA